MTNHNTDTIARYAMHPLLKTMPRDAARLLLQDRMTTLMRDALIEGDHKTDELSMAILSADEMHGPMLHLEIAKSARGVIADALCDCGTPAGFHTKGCAGIE